MTSHVSRQRGHFAASALSPVVNNFTYAPYSILTLFYGSIKHFCCQHVSSTHDKSKQYKKVKLNKKKEEKLQEIFKIGVH